MECISTYRQLPLAGNLSEEIIICRLSPGIFTYVNLRALSEMSTRRTGGGSIPASSLQGRFRVADVSSEQSGEPLNRRRQEMAKSDPMSGQHLGRISGGFRSCVTHRMRLRSSSADSSFSNWRYFIFKSRQSQHLPIQPSLRHSMATCSW